MPVKLAPFSATPSPATTPRATLRTPRAAATMSPPKSPPKSPRVPVLPFLSAAADARMAEGASANFFQGLRVSPRKPYVVPPPKLRERHGSPLRDNSPARMPDMPPALGETNEADDSAPLELMKDTSWILFPNMQVHHPYDVDVESDKLTPGSTPHAELIQTLRKVKLLQSLSDEDLVALFRAGKQKVYPRYSSIVREGARCSTCYVLLHGQAVAHSSKQGLSGQLLARGTSFGEGALVTPVQREASVSALTHCLLFMFTREDVPSRVWSVLQQVPEMQEIRTAVILALLRRAPFFEALSEAKLTPIANMLKVLNAEAGTKSRRRTVTKRSMPVVATAMTPVEMAAL